MIKIERWTQKYEWKKEQSLKLFFINRLFFIWFSIHISIEILASLSPSYLRSSRLATEIINESTIECKLNIFLPRRLKQERWSKISFESSGLHISGVFFDLCQILPELFQFAANLLKVEILFSFNCAKIRKYRSSICGQRCDNLINRNFQF